jgi:hypothetical protein
LILERLDGSVLEVDLIFFADWIEQAVETLRHAMESHEPDSYAEPYIFNMVSPFERRRRACNLIACRRHWRNSIAGLQCGARWRF